MNARIATMIRVWVTVALLAGCPGVATAADGSIVAWGGNYCLAVQVSIHVRCPMLAVRHPTDAILGRTRHLVASC